MTFRAKPVASRPHRPTRDGQSRRNLYLNIGFGLAVVLAVVILVGVAAVTWWSDHLAPAATVDGQTITIDDFRANGAVEAWRIQQQVGRVNAALAEGRLTSAEANQRLQQLNTQAQGDQLAPLVIERMIDARIQRGLANEEGVAVTPEEIDAKITEEKTIAEERHAWIIAVTPEIDDGAEEPTAAQKAAAKETADTALADLRTGGKTWEEVAKAVSTDSTAPTGGDLGWIDREAAEDEAFLEAIFAAEPNMPTEVIETEAGTYLIGRVTEIAPSSVDNAWEQKAIDAGIDMNVYRGVVEAEVIREKLEEKVVADASKEGPQRSVLEIAIQAPAAEPSSEAIKVRHILYSPKDDPGTAADVPADDPAWTEAELAAQKAYDELTEDPSAFDERARDESDEAAARGETGTGGKLPYVDNDGRFVQAFADAVLKPELQPGDILPPVRTEFGFHVIQVMYRPPDVDQMQKIREMAAGGADFEQLARDYSEGNEAGIGGDRGWIANGMLDTRLFNAINATPVGGISEIVEIEDVGVFLYKVVEERTAAPDEDQLEVIEERAFANWYGEKKDAIRITRDLLEEAGLA